MRRPHLTNKVLRGLSAAMTEAMRDNPDYVRRAWPDMKRAEDWLNRMYAYRNAKEVDEDGQQ